jgi:branched-chain amino acid transport system substrate-binding protein
MFHVEGCNTMYTKTIGRWQLSKNLIKGAKWYMLTADYAFGHDLHRVSSRFLSEHGGTVMANDMVPTNTRTTAPHPEVRRPSPTSCTSTSPASTRLPS